MGDASGRFLQYHWIVPEDLPLHYATAFVVQQTEHEYVLRVFEVKPPVVVEGMQPGDVDALLSSVDARCVGQFALSPGRARELLALLQKFVEPATASATGEEGGS